MPSESGQKGSHSTAGEQGDRDREKAQPDHCGHWRPGSNFGSHSSKTEPLDRSTQVFKVSLGHTEGRDACARLSTPWLNVHVGASDAGAMRWGPVSSRNALEGTKPAPARETGKKRSWWETLLWFCREMQPWDSAQSQARGHPRASGLPVSPNCKRKK